MKPFRRFRLSSTWPKAVPALAAVSLASVALATGVASAAAPTSNVVETAAAQPNLKAFVSLLKESGLDKTLAAGGPFTIFAPSDDAFAKLPKAELDHLQNDPSHLTATLLYHMLPGQLLSKSAMTMNEATTLDGNAKVGLSVVGASLYYGNAKVVTPDIMATNGVIDIVDTVLTAPVMPSTMPTSRAAYCAVAGDTTRAGKPIPAGRFLNLRYGQPGWDFHYAGATVAIFVAGTGLTCAAPPAGYKLQGTAPDELHVPGGLYPYYTK